MSISLKTVPGWNDKYDLLNEYESHKEQFEKFWNVTDEAEEANFIKPEGLHNSFRAFLRIVLTENSHLLNDKHYSPRQRV